MSNVRHRLPKTTGNIHQLRPGAAKVLPGWKVGHAPLNTTQQVRILVCVCCFFTRSCWSSTNPQRESLPCSYGSFCSTDTTDATTRKNNKGDHNLSEGKQKQRRKRAGSPFVFCTSGATARLKKSDRKLEKKMSGASQACHLFLVTYLFNVKEPFFWVIISQEGCRIGPCKLISIVSLGSSGRSTANAYLDRERRFLEPTYGFSADWSGQKKDDFEFSWKPRRERIGLSKKFGLACTPLCQGQCFQFSNACFSVVHEIRHSEALPVFRLLLLAQLAPGRIWVAVLAVSTNVFVAENSFTRLDM